jgi:PII-like signaling protein
MTKAEFEKQQHEQTKSLIQDAVLDIITNNLRVMIESVDTDNKIKVSLWLNDKKISSDTMEVSK